MPAQRTSIKSRVRGLPIWRISINPNVKELPNKKCLTNSEEKGVSTKTIDKSTHHKLEKVSTKAGEDLYTTTKINHLLNIVDRILHSQWKENTGKLDTS